MSKAAVIEVSKPRINHSLENLSAKFCSRYLNQQTTRNYKSDLDFFFNWLNRKAIPFEVVRPLIIESYLEDMVTHGRSRATANRSLSAIKAFYDWLVANDFAQKNPATSIKALRSNRDKTQDPFFTNEEALKMLEAPSKGSLKGNRDFVVLLLLFQLGLRREEVATLRFSHIETSREGELYLRVTGKRDKTRIIPLTGFVHSELVDYRSRYEAITGNKLAESDYMIQGSTKVLKKAPDGTMIWRIVKHYAKLVGITRTVGPHACRSTVISLLFENGTSARDIANFVGHSSLNTTLGYDKQRESLKNTTAHRVSYSPASEKATNGDGKSRIK